MRVLDLFSGIGGFSVGLGRAGMTTVAFCEIDPYCRAVLAKHWPGVPVYEDVRKLDAAELAAAGIGVDLICGGFPCQDISVAGAGRGIGGERSGLWSEFARLIREVRPRYVVVENVSALLYRGIGDVLGGMAALGYDAEWHCIPAAAIGAPHIRDRVWIIGADADRGRRESGGLAQRSGLSGEGRGEPDRLGAAGQWRGSLDAADAACVGTQGSRADRVELAFAPRLAALLGRDDAGAHWRDGTAEPPILRMAARVPGWAHRVRALGNAVVPQIVEAIGRAIIESEAGRAAS